MPGPVTALEPAYPPHAATALAHGVGLLVRFAAYGAAASFLAGYDCGQALLAGILAGDLLASVVRVAWTWRDGPAQALAELAVLLVIWLWVRHQLVWPDDPAQRALVGLAAFGVLVTRSGGEALVRLGPAHDGMH
jgi:hypothetical protein